MAKTRYRNEPGATSLAQLPAAALRAVLREGYSKSAFRDDLLAGIVVGVVALPLAMALAIGVGVPPQQGLYTAIVAGFVTALLGGSRVQVSGPTAAFIVVLAPIYVKFGLAGLLLSGFLGGLFLIALGLARMGRVIEFVPYPVTTGFSAGIATVIATLQLKDLLGLQLGSTPEHYIERVSALVGALGTVNFHEAGLGLMTLALLVALPKFLPKVPAPLIALPLAACVAAALPAVTGSGELVTIASRFTTTISGEIVHGIPALPPVPIWPPAMLGEQGLALNLDTLRQLLPGAFAIAILGAIESLLSAVVADGMARTRHDSDAELIAQGVANVIAPFFGGIASTGAIARTATNVRSGARSPIAAMIHSVFILMAVLAGSRLLGYLPMTSLAALLLVVAWRMSEAKHFVHMLRVAPRSDVAVLLTCFSLTVIFDMVIGVFVGMVLASFLFMRRMATVTNVREIARSSALCDWEVPSGIALYEVSGPLFFGAAQKAMSRLGAQTGDVRVVVLLLERVDMIDATGLVALESAIAELRAAGCRAILCDVQPAPLAVLERAGLVTAGEVWIAPTLSAGLELARELLRARGETPSTAPATQI
ncbi:MAG: putative sulfate permease, SulP family [Pseudomonadota bacterium]|jgi:SulP family sulfate permease